MYVYSQPEWTALVVSKDSAIKTVADLKGERIARDQGARTRSCSPARTEPERIAQRTWNSCTATYRFTAPRWSKARVDAWAGLDPHMAASELDAGTRLLYRNVNFNTYGFLQHREIRAGEPEAVGARDSLCTDRARSWIRSNHDEAAKILADDAKISLPVKRQLERTSFEESVLAQNMRLRLKAASPIPFPAWSKNGTDLSQSGG